MSETTTEISGEGLKYCTIDDVFRQVELDVLYKLLDIDPPEEESTTTDLLNSLPEDSSDLVEELISGASYTVDGYIRGRYGQYSEIEAVPSLIRRIAAELTIVELFRRQKFESDYWHNERSAIVAKLKDISKGIIMLPVDEESVSGGWMFTSNPRLFL